MAKVEAESPDQAVFSTSAPAGIACEAVSCCEDVRVDGAVGWVDRVGGTVALANQAGRVVEWATELAGRSRGPPAGRSSGGHDAEQTRSGRGRQGPDRETREPLTSMRRRCPKAPSTASRPGTRTTASQRSAALPQRCSGSCQAATARNRRVKAVGENASPVWYIRQSDARSFRITATKATIFSFPRARSSS